jgi:hypothetical protein
MPDLRQLLLSNKQDGSKQQAQQQQQQQQEQQQEQQRMRIGLLFEEETWNADEQEASGAQAHLMGSQDWDSSARIADLEGSSTEQPADINTGPTVDAGASGDQEWCESLTQGQVPAGAYEISDKGPKYVINFVTDDGDLT